jgi:hypothetical protein
MTVDETTLACPKEETVHVILVNIQKRWITFVYVNSLIHLPHARFRQTLAVNGWT